MNSSSAKETTEIESVGMSKKAMVTVHMHAFPQVSDVGSVSSSRTNVNGEDESDNSSTEEHDDDRMPNSPPLSHAMPFEVLVESTCAYKNTETTDSRNDGSRKGIHEETTSHKLLSPPITMSVNDFTAELTGSETSTDTKIHKNVHMICDCDVGFDDPPLPNEIPRYIFIRTAKKSPEMGSSDHVTTKAPLAIYPKLQRLLRRFHRPSQIREIPCDSDSEVVCSTLISL